MPDLARILREQSDLARVLAGLPAGHPDVRGLRQACDDWVMEEAMVRAANRKERGYLRALARRRDWLLARVAIAEDSGQHLSYDAHELAAIEWAIGKLDSSADGTGAEDWRTT